ncbi:hypothetical protein BUALT_Bualt03G0224700 [Buddleja alternifolia]|uniref:Peptidase A1 domain-containing protein n=1 Tax=Buddleja alternifolia TaxID=168488 RepID=A0AAV6XWN1_9LAMI|nr:hypothetical protein BUALT_Bualt03G0224700 [Buddleja alternifolia]
MVSKSLLFVGYFYLFSFGFLAFGDGIRSLNSNNNNLISNNNGSVFTHSFNAASASSVDSDCSFSNSAQEEIYELKDEDFDSKKPSLMLNLKHKSFGKEKMNPTDSVLDSTAKDFTRIQTLHTRIVEKKKIQNTNSRVKKDNPIVSPATTTPESYSNGFSGQLMATLESGVSLGSGEYFMDVFIGTPPKHFSLILDTGSDLNWIQSVPCYDCFEQTGPYYNPIDSSSFRNITCHDPRCSLVSSPEPPLPCKNENQSCPYYYWYGDSSNTTGDFALETFTVNLTALNGRPEFRKVENVMFGCGHWNRGLFHGASGLLGLGRGPLSFSSQLQSLYGHSFSYCLVDRNSNSSVSSKLIFGEDKGLLGHPELNFTKLVDGKESAVDTFYYLDIKSVLVGAEALNIPEETWDLSPGGGGGTIIDSGTTLSYFADPAYKIIKEAFVSKVKGYPVVKDFPILEPCYNVSGVENPDLPSFGIVFQDGATWNFPVENYFIKLEPDDVVCLAILGTPRSSLSIIGNYQQQNFHILYDTKKSRLGFAPRKCAEM